MAKTADNLALKISQDIKMKQEKGLVNSTVVVIVTDQLGKLKVKFKGKG